MIYFGKDLIESERRFGVVRADYATLCCMIGAPTLLVFWHFRQDDWLFLVFAALAVVGGVVSILKCWSVGMGRSPCDCEGRADR